MLKSPDHDGHLLLKKRNFIIALNFDQHSKYEEQVREYRVHGETKTS